MALDSYGLASFELRRLRELAPDEEPFEGVKIYDPFDELYVSQKAFDGLMNGLLTA